MAPQKTRFRELMLEKSVAVGRRLTYSDVAHDTGLGYSTIDRVANDRFVDLTYSVARTLAQYFGVSTEYFMRDSDERWPEEAEDEGVALATA